MTDGTVDGTIQATIDALKKVVADAEDKSAPLRRQVTDLREQVIAVEGPEAEKARQQLRRLGVPVFSDWQRPLLPKAAAKEPAPATSGGASTNRPKPGKK